MKKTIADLERQIKVERDLHMWTMKEVEKLKAVNEVYKFHTNFLNTLVVATERIADALAHTILEVRREVKK